MLKAEQGYYCKTNRDVDLIMSLFEKEGYCWASGTPLRKQYQQPPIIYNVHLGHQITCEQSPGRSSINDSIHVSNIQNRIISELRR